MIDRETNARHISDTAMATTRAVLEVFNLRPEEYREAHDAVFERVKAGLTAYLAFRQRELQRLHGKKPSEN